MSEHQLAMPADGGIDDLPRTLRRERDAREREAREREFRLPAPEPLLSMDRDQDARAPYVGELHAATVRRFDVPFVDLMLFCIKAVFAAIPAVIILGIVLWLLGHTLQTFFPQLVKMQILIRFPN